MTPVSAIDQAQFTGAPTVLIADDEALIASTLALVLEAHGYRTVVAHTGEEAVERAMASTPAVVICDIIMPGMSGIDAVLEIRANCPGCRIILISGDTRSAELLEQANALGHAFEVLAKPFHPARLLDMLTSDASLPGASC